MIAQLLLYKIVQLFLIMVLGYILVKAKFIKSEDSTVLSQLSLYLFMPAIIVNAFNIEMTADIAKGLATTFVVATLIHIVFLVIDWVLKKYFKATNVERASAVYSNVGNLVIPIVSFILGDEWILYASAYLVVQIIFLWTHGAKLFSDEKVNLKKILLNANVLAVIAGFVIMLTGLKLPAFVWEITSSLGAMMAPAGMIIAGMLAAKIDFRKMLGSKRLYFVTLMRLVIMPVIIVLLLKGISVVVNINDIKTILLICFIAAMTPTAATIMQLAQIYGKDSLYATGINAVTTTACIVTMPLLILLFNYLV